MLGSYNPLLVTVSFFIAVLASYTAIELSFRTKKTTSANRWLWHASSAIAAGTGIWAMHFVGMLAYALPIPIGFDTWITFISWCAPVLFSAMAFTFVHKPVITSLEFGLSSLLMGLAIAGMHYLGMYAMQMEPAIQWDYRLVAISIAIAVGLSGAAIWTLRHLLQDKKSNSFLLKICIAVLLGAAIWTMHYTGMWAAHFPVNSVCRAADQLNNEWLPTLVTIPTVMLLGVSSAIAYYEQRGLEHELMAETDALTSLKNRRYLQKQLPQLLKQTRSEKLSTHLAYLDLDGFKLINDAFGHDVGDAVLVVVAKRILECLRVKDNVIRMGGDEFVILLVDAHEEAIGFILDRILQVLNQPIQITEHIVQISGSIGLVKDSEELEADTLLIQADTAMYHAKRQGRNMWQGFTESMDRERILSADIHKKLHTAIEHNEFKLFYQPKYACGSRQIIGMETLIRWQDPQLGWRLPKDFIGIAEKTGLIGALDDWVLNEACKQVNQWIQQGWFIPVSINVSTLEIRGEGFASKVIAVLDKHKIEASALTIEVTESIALENPDKAMLIFQELENYGITVSIDDFGSGYSSLAYLKDFPAKELKIDRAFVSDAAKKPQAQELLKAIIIMGHALDMIVVAEGVEDEVTASILEELKCDVAQGYYFSPPLEALAIEALLVGNDNLRVR